MDVSELDVGTHQLPAAQAVTVADGLGRAMQQLGVVHAYGVCGGAQALLWASLSRHLHVLHFRHESGAAFAATEASIAADSPVVVFTTTGPGITNALTGMIAARSEGARVVLISAYASASHRGRGGIQETSSYTMPAAGLFQAGAWFDDAVVLDSPDQLPQVLRRISAGLHRPGGYVAHISVPNSVQGIPLSQPLPGLLARGPASVAPAVNPAAVARCVELLSDRPFAIWAGFGARHAAATLQAFAERTGAVVMCSPRAKGVIPETHPLFVGVTGMGGHTASVVAHMRRHVPHRVLVLGTRLGEPTSFWNQGLVPAGGFVHVDLDPMVPGVAFPLAETYAVQADCGDFLRAMIDTWPNQAPSAVEVASPHPAFPQEEVAGRVRPDFLMAMVQETVIDGSEAIVLAESGNAFTWATHYLRFPGPNRYRVSTNLGSMGHAATGALGAASATGRPAVVISGDGSMLMNSEVNTAVKAQLPVVWIVLNDGRYNMCFQGMAALGMGGATDASFPPVNFAELARAMGAQSIRVESEAELRSALERALTSDRPFVVDVVIDADRLAPTHGRNEGLRASQALEKHEGLSFPLITAN